MRRRDCQRLEKELEGVALDLVRGITPELLASAQNFGDDCTWRGIQRVIASLENLEDIGGRLRKALAKAEKLQGRKYEG